MNKLDELYELQAQRTVAELDKQALIDSVMTPEIKEKLDEINAEFASRVAVLDEKITILTDEIKKDVIEHGESLKGTYLQAVYMKGRVSWDTKKLEGLMMVIPQVSEARSVGEPSVSIRKIGQK